jgi:glutamate-1-semialdehyde 2,1-aminomutase
MSSHSKQQSEPDLYAKSRRFIPGGVSSINRLISPPLAFSKADGAYLWGADGKRYIDFHAAFAPYLFGCRL